MDESILKAKGLPKEKMAGKNKDYAISLTEVVKKIGLPQSYVNEVDSWSR